MLGYGQQFVVQKKHAGNLNNAHYSEHLANTPSSVLAAVHLCLYVAEAFGLRQANACAA